jgi:D-glycero-D-manno-heptose 1,7-bisphosphate phosphatase
VGYTYRVEDLEFLPGAVEAIRLLNDRGLKVIVVTNQAGVARGYYSEADVETFHRHIESELAKHGARIDAFYFCPHHPEAGHGKYRVKCDCRKPAIALYVRAIERFGIDAARSFMIGDSPIDVEAGKKAGLATILLAPGGQRPTANGWAAVADYSAPDLLAAARLVLSRSESQR